MKERAIATNFEPHECIIFAQSTKIGTHENKAMHPQKDDMGFLLLILEHSINTNLLKYKVQGRNCWPRHSIYDKGKQTQYLHNYES